MNQPVIKWTGSKRSQSQVILKYFPKQIDCYYESFIGGGAEDNTFDVPKEIYNNHIYIKSGNSSFKRTLVNKNDSIVFESLYIKKERE